MSIFKENVAYRPFTYPWAIEAEKIHRVDMSWNENQIDLQDDLRQYHSKGELATADVSHEDNKYLIDTLLLLFTEMEVHVAAGYGELIPHVKNNEIKTLWFTFAAREVTHQRAYALGAETFGFSNSDWSEFKKYKEMQDKIGLISQDVGDLSVKLNFCKKLVIMSSGEGIALFGAFSNLLNLRRFGKLMAFNSVNEWSLKDEDDHVSRNIKILKEARKELTKEENLELDEFTKKVVQDYVDAEHLFFDLVFQRGNQQDLTKQQAKDFLTYLGDLRLCQHGLKDSRTLGENPLEWIDYILSGSTHTNFFENKVTDYSHDGLAGEGSYDKFLAQLEENYLK